MEICNYKIVALSLIIKREKGVQKVHTMCYEMLKLI